MKHRLDLWACGFGDEYHARNQISPETLQARERWLGTVLKHMPEKPTSVLEVGCGVGANLAALRTVLPGAKRYGCEPNTGAAAQAMKHASMGMLGVATHAANSMGSHDNGEFDLVMTSGVLIHIPAEGLRDAMTEIHRVAKRYILCAEYFAPREEEVRYHGEGGALWRRDYGGLWMDYLSIEYVAHGFLWRRWDGLDNLVWWLFEKKGL